MFEINCYNYKRCQGLNCELMMGSTFEMEGEQVYLAEPDGQNHIYFIIEGESLVGLGGLSFKAAANDLVFVASDKGIEMHCISENLRVLHIAFHIYILQSSGYDEENNVLTRSYTRCKMVIREIINIAKYNAMYAMLSQIIHEIEWQHKMYISVVKSLLDQLVITLFRAEGIMPSPIEHINSIAFWSGPEGDFEIPEDTELFLSDVEFFSGCDSIDANDRILGMICPQRYYIEKERSMDKVVCYTAEEERLMDKPTQVIASFAKTNFKVWFFLERGIKDMNLRPFINNGYVRFYARCNKSFRCVFSMYHQATYSCISSVIDISQSDEWQEFKIPFSSENGKVAVSDYIEMVLVYIRENYTHKITLDDLCDYVHLQKAYLCTVFKNHMQMSIGEYIRLYRVNIAKNLLLETKHKAEDIAAMSGFYDIHHFSRTFKQIVGINPSEFRKNNHAMPKAGRRDKFHEKI